MSLRTSPSDIKRPADISKNLEGVILEIIAVVELRNMIEALDKQKVKHNEAFENNNQITKCQN